MLNRSEQHISQMFIPQIRVLTCTHCVSYCNLHNALISSQVALAVHDDELLRLYQVGDDQQQLRQDVLFFAPSLGCDASLDMY